MTRSKKERALLELLITKYPSSTSYENIERFVYEFNSSKNAIKLLVKSLREKTSKELIINISGFGYKIILDLNE
ncbi:MAG: helix-turn-helix domain-containing protein [Campylobacteraceae bacterium]|nr:helix-turn-helix domain-containing protein [Campylobacteraceae bacterium]